MPQVGINEPPSEHVSVRKSTMEAILSIALVGEEQKVAYRHDHREMAIAAALLSKDQCSQIIKHCMGALGR